MGFLGCSLHTRPGPVYKSPPYAAPSVSPNSSQDRTPSGRCGRPRKFLAAYGARELRLLLMLMGTSRWPRKKMPSTLLRLGPPLAGEPSVFCAWSKIMLESVRMNVSHSLGS